MRIHHLALRSPDPAALSAFYRDLLGLEEVRRQEEAGERGALPEVLRSVWLRAGQAVVMIERAGEGEPAPPEGSLELIAFAASEAERGAMEARLGAAGVEVEARTGFTIYFRDPEGRRIGVSSYPFEELRGPG